MPVNTTTDTAEVAELADALVRLDPLRNTLFGTIAASARQPDAAPWAAYLAADPRVAAARSEAATPVALTNGWDAPAELTDAIAALDPPAVAVGGPVPIVDAVSELLGGAVTGRTAERLHRLDALQPPRGVSGTARLAGIDDLDRIGEWAGAFAAEAFGRPFPGSRRAMAERYLDTCHCWLWEDAGTPRAMAIARASHYGVARIGPVYTPPAERGHGYASGATAAASRAILEAGAVPCLYTDLANPTANRIYAAIGFIPVADRAVVRFGRPAPR